MYERRISTVSLRANAGEDESDACDEYVLLCSLDAGVCASDTSFALELVLLQSVLGDFSFAVAVCAADDSVSAKDE